MSYTTSFPVTSRLLGLLLLMAVGFATPAFGRIATTTQIEPPTIFQVGLQGIIPEGALYADREVVEIRLNWTVEVAEGNDARYIYADFDLPTTGPGGYSFFSWTGESLGWSGSGQFTYSFTVNPTDNFFGPELTFWGWQAVTENSTLLDPEAVEILTNLTSLEIDYIAEPLLGDTNDDGAVDTLDIDPFVLLLTDPAGYATAFPGVDPLAVGDVNLDLVVDTLDIDPFVALLTSGSLAAGGAVPEPGTIMLLAMAGGLVWFSRRVATPTQRLMNTDQ